MDKGKPLGNPPRTGGIVGGDTPGRPQPTPRQYKSGRIRIERRESYTESASVKTGIFGGFWGRNEAEVPRQCGFPIIGAGSLWGFAVRQVLQDAVDQPIGLGFLGQHEIIPVGILLDPVQGLAGVLQ